MTGDENDRGGPITWERGCRILWLTVLKETLRKYGCIRACYFQSEDFAELCLLAGVNRETVLRANEINSASATTEQLA